MNTRLHRDQGSMSRDVARDTPLGKRERGIYKLGRCLAVSELEALDAWAQERNLGGAALSSWGPSQASLGIGNSFRPFRLTVKPRAPKPLPRIAPPCLG